MEERPRFQPKIVGGTDYAPKPLTPEEQKEKDQAALVSLWRRITDHLPANYDISIRQDDAVKLVSTWQVTRLTSYLKGAGLWGDATEFTTSVIEEVRKRIDSNDFSPRKRLTED